MNMTTDIKQSNMNISNKKIERQRILNVLYKHYLLRDSRNKKGKRASLKNFDISYRNFSELFLEGSFFSNSDISYCNFRKSNLQNVNFDGVEARGVNFSSCNLKGVSFKGAKLIECDFTYSQLENACFESAIIEGCFFGYTNLVGAKFTNELMHCHVFDSSTVEKAQVPFFLLCKDYYSIIENLNIVENGENYDSHGI